MKNKKGQVISEFNPIEPKRSKWVIIIFVIVLILLLITFVIIKTIVKSSMTKTLYKELDKTLLGSVNSGLNTISHENRTINDISEMQNQLNQNKLFVENQLNDIKTKGETEVYDIDASYKCPNGDIINTTNKLCDGGILIENRGYKKLKEDGNRAFISIAANSMVLSLTEYTLGSYQYLQTSKNDINVLVGQTLETLDYLAKKVYIWQVYSGAVGNVTKDNQSLLYKNPQKVIINLENFNKNYRVITEQEIQSINLKEKCIDLFNKIQSNKYPSNQFSNSQKTMPKNNFLFISPDYSQICKNFEDIKKEQAIKMLNKIENEKNPFVAIESKLYLNLFVKCNNEWFFLSYNEDKPCMEAQKRQLINDLQTELNRP